MDARLSIRCRLIYCEDRAMGMEMYMFREAESDEVRGAERG